jgi:hypothetical protein
MARDDAEHCVHMVEKLCTKKEGWETMPECVYNVWHG